MLIKPLGTNCLIEIEKMDESALKMVDENEAKTEIATIVEPGEEVTKVKKGDKIVFKSYNLDTILIDNQEITLIPEDDIKAIII